jgi:hypothetical protein
MSATTRNHRRKTHSAARAAALVLGAGVAVAACGTAAHSATDHPANHPTTKPATHAHVVGVQTKPVTVETVEPNSGSQTANQTPSGGQTTGTMPAGCSDSQLSESMMFLGAGMGSAFLELAVQNVSSTTCTVSGPASFIMTGVNGQPLTNGVNWPIAQTSAPRIVLAPGAGANMTLQYHPQNFGPGGPQTGCAMLATVQAGMSNAQGVGGGVVVPLPGGPKQVCGAVGISFLSPSVSSDPGSSPSGS